MFLKGTSFHDVGRNTCNGRADWCHGSYYLKGQWKGAVDPILPVGQLMCTVDPATQWAGDQVP